MKKFNIYIITSVLFISIYILLAYVAVQLIAKESTVILLDNELQSIKVRSEQLAVISGDAFKMGIEKNRIVNDIQKSIEANNDGNSFISVIDWSGRVICYPDITKVGNIDKKTNAMVANMKSYISAEDLYGFIEAYDNMSEDNTQIVKLEPILNSDLIIATHINTNIVKDKFSTFKSRFNFIFIILGLLLLVILFGITRILKNHYEAILEHKSSQLQDSVVNLSKLNLSLENYQKNIAQQKAEEAKTEQEVLDVMGDEAIKDIPKKRLLTYVRNELMPIAIEDISYIYLENTITYIIRKDGKRFTANDSLDQIYSSLDNKLFFRVNRQIIVSIYAIDKIIKFGNNSLKIETKPSSEIDIIIGKNKASTFKQWLDL